MFKFDRRSALMAGVLSAVALVVAACNGGGSAGSAEGEMALGSPDAPVTVVEYASVTCGHCAAWSQQVYPEFKRRYVDTGQVRLVFRELPTPPAPVAVAGFLTARCAADGNPERYFAMIESMMRGQQQLFANPRQYLLDTARQAGMSEAEFDACVTDEAALNAMNDRIAEAQGRGVTGTPFFFVNDQRHEDISIDGFEAALRPLIGGEPIAPTAGAPAAPAATTPAATTPAAPAEAPAQG